jgi:hypothetical protein
MYDRTAGRYLLVATNNGNVLIGTTTDAGYKLDVSGTGRFSDSLLATTSAAGSLTAKIRNTVTAASGSTGYGLAIESEASGATSYALTVRNLAESTTYLHVSTAAGTAGNVGIGTTSPARKLDVAGTSIFRDFTTVVSSNGNPVSNTTWLSTDSGITNIYTGGNSTVQLNSNGVSYFNGGNVGIGTTSPSQKLEVSGGILGGPVYTTSRFIVNSTASPGISDISLGSYVGGSWLNTPASTTGYLSVGGSAAFSYSSSNLIWYTDSGSGITEKMRITAAGNVGIGTTSPTEKLELS